MSFEVADGVDTDTPVFGPRILDDIMHDFWVSGVIWIQLLCNLAALQPVL